MWGFTKRYAEQSYGDHETTGGDRETIDGDYGLENLPYFTDDYLFYFFISYFQSSFLSTNDV